MEINWMVIGIVVSVVIVLLVYIIRKNAKDKKDLVNALNNNYKKADEEEAGDNDND